MPKGRPITVNLKAMSFEERVAYRREASRRHRLKHKKRPTAFDVGPDRKCISCQAVKPRTEESFEINHGAFRAECKECKFRKQKARRIKAEYGGTIEEYEATMRDASCAICGSNKKLVLDHCHNKGHVRGVLCSHCNSMLGFARDDENNLRAAIDYLERTRNGFAT